MERVEIWSTLAGHRCESFFSRLITGDQKWIIYSNVVRKQTPLNYELLPHGETITADVYCAQLTYLNQKITETRPVLTNRKSVVMQHDNARPHVVITTQQKLVELAWKILPHPSYGPKIAPSDYHLFRPLQHFLNDKSFNFVADVDKALQQFFRCKSKFLYERGIDLLPERL